MIALSFALPEESKGFVALMQRPRQEGEAVLPVISGLLGGKEVAVVHTGMGVASTKLRLAPFFENRQPALLIAAGFGGALDPALEVGDLVLGANYSDAALVKTVEGRVRCRTGNLASVEEVVETRAAKAELARRTGAICVEMETAEIARQCGLRGVPMLAVRAISDTALDDLPVPAAVWFDAARQRPRPGALAWHLATHPARIPPFARFVAGISIARERLTGFLVEALSVL